MPFLPLLNSFCSYSENGVRFLCFLMNFGAFYKYLKTVMAKEMIEVHCAGTDF